MCQDCTNLNTSESPPDDSSSESDNSESCCNEDEALESEILEEEIVTNGLFYDMYDIARNLQVYFLVGCNMIRMIESLQCNCKYA